MEDRTDPRCNGRTEPTPVAMVADDLWIAEKF